VFSCKGVFATLKRVDKKGESKPYRPELPSLDVYLLSQLTPT